MKWHIAFPEGVGFLKGIVRDIFSGRKGSVLIIVAVALVALLGIAALVVDAGLLYYTKVFLSNAADAAALAGVQELWKDQDVAVAIAKTYAESNGVDEGGVIAEILPDGRTIKVTTSKTVSLVFARVLGFSSTDVKASAKARVGTAKSAKNVVPFGVVWGDFEFGEKKTLKVSAGDASVVRGNFGALALGGKEEEGGDAFRDNIKKGYEGILKVGDEVPTLIWTKPGNMSGPTCDGVNYRLSQCTHDPPCTIEHFVRGCPRIVIVPVVRTFEHVHGRGEVELLGFAAFILEGVAGSGNEAYVTGWFIEWATEGDLGNKDDYGVVSYRLEE